MLNVFPWVSAEQAFVWLGFIGVQEPVGASELERVSSHVLGGSFCLFLYYTGTGIYMLMGVQSRSAN